MYLYLTRLMDFNCVKPRDRVNFLHKRKKTNALGSKCFDYQNKYAHQATLWPKMKSKRRWKAKRFATCRFEPSCQAALTMMRWYILELHKAWVNGGSILEYLRA